MTSEIEAYAYSSRGSQGDSTPVPVFKLENFPKNSQAQIACWCEYFGHIRLPLPEKAHRT
jgi:hypothetical protein